MKELLTAILLAAALMTNAGSQGQTPTNGEQLNISDVEESTQMQTRIMELLQTDEKHAKQALAQLEQIDLMPDEVLGVEQMENGYYKMTFMHDGKCYTAELTRKKYIDCVRDETGEVIYAEIY